MKTFFVVLIIASMPLTALHVHAQNECAGVDTTLTRNRSDALAPVVAKQLGAKQVKISQSFSFGDWSILYASTGEADDVYVFYVGDPMQKRYVTLWGGVAMDNEEEEIRAWTLKNAPGIPRTLAQCFAWHVTKEHQSANAQTQ